VKEFIENAHSFTMNEGESKMTIMKPGSQENAGKLIWVYQDAYGEVKTGLESIDFLTTHFPALGMVRKQLEEIAAGITFLTPLK
jgi:hypothetical protein